MSQYVKRCRNDKCLCVILLQSAFVEQHHKKSSVAIYWSHCNRNKAAVQSTSIRNTYPTYSVFSVRSIRNINSIMTDTLFCNNSLEMSVPYDVIVKIVELLTFHSF